VIGVKTHRNEGRGADLEFWSDAVEYQKVDLDGLALVGREALATDAGLKGTLFEFALGEGEARYTYLVALFVDAQRIVTIEAAGPQPDLQTDRDKLLTAVKSLR